MVCRRTGRLIRVVGLGRYIPRRHGRGDQLPGTRDVGVAAGAGEQPVVADPVEALGQGVEQEAPDELVRRQRHRAVSRPPVMAIVLVAEGDAALVETDEAAVRDGDAVGVAGEIGEHRLGPGEGRLGVDTSASSAAARDGR